MSLLARFFSALVHAYQYLLSPYFGTRCRFAPTCSNYALGALAKHGAFRGAYLTARRIMRCHPFCSGGYDPVP